MSEQRVRLRLETAPHSPKQALVMNAFFIPGLLEMWVACGTKFGKTYALSSAFSLYAPLKEQALFRWIAPFYNQSKIGYKYCKRMLPNDPKIVHPNNSDMSLSFPYHDTQIQYFHGQNSEAIEGEATAGNGLDEAAKLKEEVYTAVKTTTTVTEGPIIGVSTPNGRNWFFKKCMEAKEEMIRARRENRRPTKIFIHAPTRDNPQVSQRVLDDAKLVLPERLYRQYYEAEFLEDGSVFLFVWEAFGRPTADQWWKDCQVWYDQSHESKALYFSADWARKSDYSVFTCINDQGKLVGFKRFNGVGWIEQVAAFKAFADQVKANSILIAPHREGLHDATGIGDVVDDIIRASNFDWDIKPIVWNNSNKEAFVADLMLSFEEQVLMLAPIEEMRNELSTFEVSLTKTGKTTYAASPGTHDDIVMSLVLSNSLYRQARGSVISVGFINNIDNLVTQLRIFGDSFLED